MRRVRVVVLDNDDDARHSLTAALQADEHFDVVASTGSVPEAVAVASGGNITAIIDLPLPMLASDDVLRAFHRASGTCRTIVFTAARVGGVTKTARPRDVIRAVAGTSHGPTLASTLPPVPASLVQARRLVAKACDLWGCEEILEDSRTVVGELVTNAVRHVGRDCDLRLRLCYGALRIEVADGAPEPPSVRLADAASIDGRGLVMIDAVVSVWGVDPGLSGKTVWADIPFGNDPAQPAKLTDLPAKTAVEVQNLFDGRWHLGFAVVGINEDGYWLERGDGSQLPVPIRRDRVRQTLPR